MLKHERGKLKSDSSDDEDDKWIADTNKRVDEKSISENTLSQLMSDGNNMIEVCQKSTLQDIHQKDESMATEQDSNDASQIEMLQQLQEVGPEDFLQIQLRNLTFSVLEESLHSVQEYFLNSLQENCSDTALCNLLASQTPAIVQDAALNFILEMEKKFLGNGPRGDSRGARAAAELEPCRACAERSAAEVATAAASQPAAAGAGSAEASTKVAAAQALLATATPPAPAAPLQQPPPPPPPPPAEPAVAPCGSPPRSGTCARKGDEREPLLADARGESGDRDTQEDLQKAPVTSLLVDAMQEAVLENAQIKDSSELTVEEKEQKVKLSENKESQKLDAAGGDKLDCQDLQKSLNAEIQKHAQELAVFRDEAYQLIENWKTSDSPPATPEELEFLQELSLLLDQRPEKPDDNTNKDAYALAHQLLKFWKVANFPLSPVAQRGLQRLQEALEVPGQKAEGKVTMENNVPDDAEGIREVEAALREVRDAFRDVKHVFEVQRCFRDLRECFREVRRAYRTREPRPRALPPCADAPAAAAAAAAAAALAAEALAQAKKRGHASSEVSGSRTPSPPGTPLHSQPKKKQQQKPCPTCNVMAGGMGEGVLNQVDSASGAVGDDDAAAAVAEKTTEAPQAEVSKSFQSAATMTSDLESTTVTSTLDQAAQTISTGAVLALHLLPDE
ncbi:hypothetical protein R5R35_005699 [Gryllus longicercus]|uniref:Uncharacterized protein n=1 Tax=Gryllus longicercus TaxID=2509291 RepID=A0AAN9VZM3_9ORTH